MENIRYPPEWEHLDAMWISWPSTPSVCRSIPEPSSQTIADLVASISVAVDVRILVNSQCDIDDVKFNMIARQVNLDRISFHKIQRGDEWIRDFGPIFVQVGSALEVISFDWNFWGYLTRGYVDEYIQESAQDHQAVAEKCAKELGLTLRRVSLVSEGGNREFNGQQVMISTLEVEKQRNPSMTQQDIENQLKNVFNLSTIIWMNKGVADDDHMFNGPYQHSTINGAVLQFNAPTTGGHCDEFVKWLDPSTILLAEVEEDERTTPIGSITHTRMEENYRILTGPNMRDAQGEPFKIVRIPTPPTIAVPIYPGDEIWSTLEYTSFEPSWSGEKSVISGKELLKDRTEANVILPASYVNFVISNDVIVLPKYGKDDLLKYPWISAELNAKCLLTDAKAKQVIKTHFPNHKIVQIESIMALNIGGGGMHCSTQQQPSVMRK